MFRCQATTIVLLVYRKKDFCAWIESINKFVILILDAEVFLLDT